MPLPALFGLACVLLVPESAASQVLPFQTPTGVTAGFNENAARHFVSVLGRSGLVRDGEAVADPMERDHSGLAVVNGAILGGFTPFWTVRLVVPWVRKTLDFRAPDGSRASRRLGWGIRSSRASGSSTGATGREA